MAVTYKRLFAGLGTPFTPTLAYTVPGSTQDVVGQITVTNAPADSNAGLLAGSAATMVPTDVVVNPVTGDVYVLYLSCIYKISAAGKIRLFAGHPVTQGTADGTGLSARFQQLCTGVINPAGTHMYVFDQNTGAVIREVALSTGVVTTRAGQFGVSSNTNNTTGTAGTLAKITDASYQRQLVTLDIKAGSPDVLYVGSTANAASTVRTVTLSGNFPLDTVTYTGSATTPWSVQVSSDGNSLYCFTSGSTVIRFPIAGGAAVTLLTLTTGGPSNGTATPTYVNAGNNFATSVSALRPWIDDSEAPRSFRIYWADQQRVAVCGVFASDNSGTAYSSSTITNSLVGSAVGDFRAAPTLTLGDTSGYGVNARHQYVGSIKKVGNSLVILTNGTANGVFVSSHNVTVGRISLDSLLYHRIAGFVPANSESNSTRQMEGAALLDAPGYFNIYVVPNGETLDRQKHCRFRDQQINPNETWEAQLKTSLGAGDKIYIEPLSMQLNFEISSIEVA